MTLNRTIKTAFVLASFTFTFCDEPKTLSEEVKGNLAMEIKETLDSYNADIKENGLISEFKYLDSTKEFNWKPPGFANSISYDSVASILKMNAGKYSEIENAFENLTIDVITETEANYNGKIRSKMTDTAGVAITMYLEEKGKLVKRTDGWKLLSGETTVSSK